MALEFVRNDITKMKVDAIVNAANETLLGGGGVDGAIHAAAGPELLMECRTLHGCRTGEAKLTKGYRLPAKYVIHTVGPIYEDGRHQEAELLASCYRNSLTLAAETACESVAFPLISAGAYGYPKAEAIRIAVETITDFLASHDLQVYLVFFGLDTYELGEERFGKIRAFIDDCYAEVREESVSYANQRRKWAKAPAIMADMAAAAPAPADFHELLDESFQEMLFRKIDEKGMSDVDCYKRANIDRKLFSKIRSNVHYKPKKSTVLAFAVALEMTVAEAEELLKKAGFALSDSLLSDVIVKYYLSTGVYDIFEVNGTLFAYDLPQLGLSE